MSIWLFQTNHVFCLYLSLQVLPLPYKHSDNEWQKSLDIFLKSVINAVVIYGCNNMGQAKILL